MAAFEPDYTILFLRHPSHNAASLSPKPFGNRVGSVDDKLVALEAGFDGRAGLFDAVVTYEDLVTNLSRVEEALLRPASTPANGAAAAAAAPGGVAPPPPEGLLRPGELAELVRFNRSIAEIGAFGRDHCKWCVPRSAFLRPAALAPLPSSWTWSSPSCRRRLLLSPSPRP